MLEKSQVEVAEKVPWNSSCHTPIIFKIPIHMHIAPQKPNKEISYMVPKDSIRPEVYKSVLHDTLHDIDSNFMSPKDAVQMTILGIAEIQSGDLRRKSCTKKRPHVLPHDILEAKKSSKRVFYLWKMEGRPGPTHPLTIQKTKL